MEGAHHFVPMPQVLQKWFREEGFILAMLAPLWGGVHSEHHRGEGMMGRAIGVVAVGNQEGAGDEAREGSGTGNHPPFPSQAPLENISVSSKSASLSRKLQSGSP